MSARCSATRKSIGAEGGKLSDLLANMKDRKAKFTFALDGETGFDT